MNLLRVFANADTIDSESAKKVLAIMKASRVLTTEEKAALKARMARLMTPEAFSLLLTEFRENAAKIVAVTGTLLEAKHR